MKKLITLFLLISITIPIFRVLANRPTFSFQEVVTFIEKNNFGDELTPIFLEIKDDVKKYDEKVQSPTFHDPKKGFHFEIWEQWFSQVNKNIKNTKDLVFDVANATAHILIIPFRVIVNIGGLLYGEYA